MKAIVINQIDNVSVALTDLKKGESVCGVVLLEDVAKGHKFAQVGIAAGGEIIKYGNRIGYASKDIRQGEHVHTHNARTALTERQSYSYSHRAAVVKPLVSAEGLTVNVYKRANGTVATRNELWVVPTVGCVNAQARMIADAFVRQADGVDGVFSLEHPYGCSQTGDDHVRTRTILQNIVRHPNAGGVLVLGLGCENNRIDEFRAGLGEFDERRIKFLVAQEAEDEIAEGLNLLKQLYSVAKEDRREQMPISCLNIGLKCGGSDGLSGITANPLLGLLSDSLTAVGATTVLTEVPEMFGAEQLLMDRAESKEVYDKIVCLINDFKDYYTTNRQPVYENPSPGNKAGGITTLEDKSLGCTQKSGAATVVDVLRDGERLRQKGLNLLNGPGNDIVAVTNLGAAGCHMILFTTGRGTPLGAFVPTVKVSTNSELYARKPSWIDFNAGQVLEGGFENALKALLQQVVSVASGQKTRSEALSSREISIFKTGVTL